MTFSLSTSLLTAFPVSSSQFRSDLTRKCKVAISRLCIDIFHVDFNRSDIRVDQIIFDLRSNSLSLSEFGDKGTTFAARMAESKVDALGGMVQIISS